MQSDIEEKKKKFIPITFFIEEEIYKEVKNEVDKLENEYHHFISKTQWIVQAIKERLVKEEKIEFTETKIKEIRFSIRISEVLNNRIQAQVDKINKTQRSRFTRIEWIKGAIKEKLKKSK